ncbi:hypothetical protein V6N13_018933 [Hibiscus sabdariffa]|uniref:Uncharacterized protein n=1 Tax=Hibiscus sabdariffa TaxID=183260 RepID=A0ABR2EKF0_9ROSI
MANKPIGGTQRKGVERVNETSIGSSGWMNDDEVGLVLGIELKDIHSGRDSVNGRDMVDCLVIMSSVLIEFKGVGPSHHLMDSQPAAKFVEVNGRVKKVKNMSDNGLNSLEHGITQ